MLKRICLEALSEEKVGCEGCLSHETQGKLAGVLHGLSRPGHFRTLSDSGFLSYLFDHHAGPTQNLPRRPSTGIKASTNNAQLSGTPVKLSLPGKLPLGIPSQLVVAVPQTSSSEAQGGPGVRPH